MRGRAVGAIRRADQHSSDTGKFEHRSDTGKFEHRSDTRKFEQQPHRDDHGLPAARRRVIDRWRHRHQRDRGRDIVALEFVKSVDSHERIDRRRRVRRERLGLDRGRFDRQRSDRFGCNRLDDRRRHNGRDVGCARERFELGRDVWFDLHPRRRDAGSVAARGTPRRSDRHAVVGQHVGQWQQHRRDRFEHSGCEQHRLGCRFDQQFGQQLDAVEHGRTARDGVVGPHDLGDLPVVVSTTCP
jgi:hypothetical protein